MTTEPILRRVPQQSRGQRRIAAILDAAEQLFAEVGYDATTTNAIAARAHTAIGSLYQFFPNKEAILRAVVARFLEQLRALLDAALADVAARGDLSPEQTLDRVLDPLIGLYAGRAGILRVFLGLHGAGDLAGAPRVLTDEIVARLEAVMARREPGLSPEQRRLHAQVVVEVVRALLPLTVTRDGALREEMVGEMKRVVRAYLRAIRDERSALTAPG
jgi:AcrR family transcriptional regulator